MLDCLLQVAHPLLVKPLAAGGPPLSADLLRSASMTLCCPALKVHGQGTPAAVNKGSAKEDVEGGFRTEALPVHSLSTAATHSAWLAAAEGQPPAEHVISKIRQMSADRSPLVEFSKVTSLSSVQEQAVEFNHQATSHAPIEVTALACNKYSADTAPHRSSGVERRVVVLAPCQWASVIMSAWVHAGAVPIGQDEEHQLNAARLKPTFPFDFPYTEAYWCASFCCQCLEQHRSC
jgi:hypothetical protein